MSTAANPWHGQRTRMEEREQKRRAVLETAARLFSAQGYRNTSLDDVARALEVTKPALYNYFKNKDEILFACARTGLDQLSNTYAAIKTSNRPGLEKLRTFLEKYTELISTDYGRCLVRIGDHELAPDSRKQLQTLKSAIDKKLRGLIADAMDDGSIRACDAKITGFALAGLLNSIAHWHQPHTGLNAQDIAKHYIDLVVDGLRPRG